MGLSREEVASRIRQLTGGSTSFGTLGRWEKTGALTVGELRIVSQVLGVPAWLLLAPEAALRGVTERDVDAALESLREGLAQIRERRDPAEDRRRSQVSVAVERRRGGRRAG
jgi:transcriptional regulator with XRE-family HTH domain